MTVKVWVRPDELQKIWPEETRVKTSALTMYCKIGHYKRRLNKGIWEYNLYSVYRYLRDHPKRSYRKQT